MSDEKTGWKDYLLMISVFCIIIMAGWLYAQSQKADSLPQGIGDGDNDFWTKATSHPSWALAAVQSEPVLIFAHSEGCAPCIEQTEICESVDAKFSGDIQYYGLLSGVDAEASACFSAYDPNGGAHYVPLTIVLTKGPDDTILWHSWEGVVVEPALTGWIETAIEYHSEYSEDGQ